MTDKAFHAALTQSRWRKHCRPIIARVLQETAGQDEKTIRKALYDAYPYGERANHPYQMWNKEIRCQRGLDRPKQRDLAIPSDVQPDLMDLMEEPIP